MEPDVTLSGDLNFNFEQYYQPIRYDVLLFRHKPSPEYAITKRFLRKKRVQWCAEYISHHLVVLSNRFNFLYKPSVISYSGVPLAGYSLA